MTLNSVEEPQARLAARGKTRRRRWTILVGGALFRVLASTWRIRVVNGEVVRELRRARRPIIFAFWHGRMLPLLWQHRREGVSILISEHGDGEIIARIGESLGYRTVRGSTTRGGGRALLGVIRVVENGGDVALTPDGPRGPAEQFAAGALVAAQRTGAPIVGVSAGAKRAWRLRSWDRFRIPKPFTRVTIAYADPEFLKASSARAAAAEAPRLGDILSALSHEVGD